MAIKPFNSVAGFSVGEFPTVVTIHANGDVVASNLTTSGTSNLNAVGNVKISGGSAGQVLSTDGTGNLSWTTVASGTLSNGTSNISVLNSANINFSSAGNANVVVMSGTGINVAGTLNASGNANVGNLGVAQVLASANITAPQLISNIATGTAPFVVTSTTKVSNLNADTVDGFDTAIANTVSTIAVRDANGNISANYFIGNGSQLTGIITSVSNVSNGTSNLNIPAVNGNVNISSAGNANILVVTGTGVNVAGTLNATGNATVGNLGATQITASTITSNIATGTAPFTVTSTTRVSNLNVAYANVSDFGAVTTQTTGTFYPVFVSGSSSANYAHASNSVFSANFANGAFTATTFVGSLSGTATSATNASALLQNTSSATTVYPTFTTSSANGNSSAVFNTSVSANLANASITATTFVGALSGAATTAGTVTTNAQPNITSVGTLTSLAVTGNTTVGNLIGPHANGNSNINIPAANGNVNISAAGNANILVVTGTGVNVVGTLNATGALTTSNDLSVSGNAVITGNLAVNGTLTYINTDTLAVEDPIVNFQTGPNGAAPVANTGKDVGTALNYYDSVAKIAFMGWDVSNAEFGMASIASITGEVVTFSTYGNLRIGNIIGNGQALTGLNASNITGTVTSATNASALLQNTSSATTVYPTFTTSSANGNSSAVFNTSISANLANAAISATTFVGALSGAATTAGTVTSNAQPNITSVGTLTSLSVSGNISSGNISGTNGNITTANVSGNLILGNSTVTTVMSWASVTTTAVTANQTIAQFSTTGVTGIEFLVKGIDATGAKYSTAIVSAVTDGTNVDYSTFGGVTLGGYTGALAVNVSGGQVRLQVTPASSNSTVWTTQYRFV